MRFFSTGKCPIVYTKLLCARCRGVFTKRKFDSNPIDRLRSSFVLQTEPVARKDERIVRQGGGALLVLL